MNPLFIWQIFHVMVGIPLTSLTLQHFCACSGLFFVFDGLSWDVVVCFVNICGIVDHHCFNFLFITKAIHTLSLPAMSLGEINQKEHLWDLIGHNMNQCISWCLSHQFWINKLNIAGKGNNIHKRDSFTWCDVINNLYFKTS